MVTQQRRRVGRPARQPARPAAGQLARRPRRARTSGTKLIGSGTAATASSRRRPTRRRGSTAAPLAAPPAPTAPPASPRPCTSARSTRRSRCPPRSNLANAHAVTLVLGGAGRTTVTCVADATAVHSVGGGDRDPSMPALRTVDRSTATRRSPTARSRRPRPASIRRLARQRRRADRTVDATRRRRRVDASHSVAPRPTANGGRLPQRRRRRSAASRSAPPGQTRRRPSTGRSRS